MVQKLRSRVFSDPGEFKTVITAALYTNDDLYKLLTGSSGKKSLEEFKKHVFSHLFIDDTITETDSFIFYDVDIPSYHPQTKSCRVLMYIITHRDILDNCYHEKYIGNRADILTAMVKDTLVGNEEVAQKFGIGPLNIESEAIYNSSRFYGRSLMFTVPNFVFTSKYS